MTDDNQSEGKEEALPTSQEQEPETPAEPEATEANEEKQEEAPVEETPQEELPEGVKERTTEQFDKLKNQLAEERAKNARGTSVFDNMRGPVPQDPQQAQQPNPFIPEQQQEEPLVEADGTVDINKINNSFEQFNQAEERIMQREQRFLRMEEDRQTQEAHEAHPELDPQGNSFDPDLFDMVSAVAAQNMVNGGTKSIKQITDEVKGFRSSPKEEKKVRKQAIQDFKEGQEKKDQGPIEEGKGGERKADTNLAELKERTRQGDSSALDQRLKDIDS